MSKTVHAVLFSFLIVAPALLAQDKSTGGDQTVGLKRLVIADDKSDDVIAVPPIKAVSFMGTKHEKHSDAEGEELSKWIKKEASLNGLASADLLPWHIVVSYDEFDEDGDNVRSGVYEEYWAGPKKFKRVYKSDYFNQTDYATDLGLYRRGDQQWPNRTLLQVRAEITDPLYYATTLGEVRPRQVERNFNKHKLECTVLEADTKTSEPPQYCFEPGRSILRYNRGFTWYQTAYNEIAAFQGRYLAHRVDITNGGKRYLELRVDKIESLDHIDDADFAPPTDAKGPIERVSGLQLMPTKMVYPQWPPWLNGQHFMVTVEIVVGTDGHVVSAHAISGPEEHYKTCEKAIQQWTFPPYFVLDKAVEVEMKVGCGHH